MPGIRNCLRAALALFCIVIGGCDADSGSSIYAHAARPDAEGGVPAAAAAVGYTTRTFGSAVDLGSNWLNWSFYNAGAQPADATRYNRDGSLLLSGIENNGYGATIATAQRAREAPGWNGAAFGGGAYFEATLSFTGPSAGPFLNGGPAFWMLDIEHLSEGPYNINWPSGPSGCIHFFEVDVMEYDTGKANGFQNGIATWFASANGACGHGATFNPNTEIPGAVGGVLVPPATDFSKPHRYALLWVPATGSGNTTASQGYLKFYFDGHQLGHIFTWNYYDPSLAERYPAFPPVNGTSAMSGMDWRHMTMILGTGKNYPMVVHAVSVWQQSNLKNLFVAP